MMKTLLSLGMKRMLSGAHFPNQRSSMMMMHHRFRLASNRTSTTSTKTNPSRKNGSPRVKLSSKRQTEESEHIFNAPSSLGRQDEGLSRYPNLQSPGGVLRGLDYLGTVTFALTGSVTAAQSGLDVFGCCMVGTVTGIGGGTLRDAIFLSKRPFWTFETEYIWMTLLTSFLTFFAWPSVIEYQNSSIKEKEYDKIDASLDTFDSIGLAAFAIIGAQNGVRAGTSMVVSSICGMATSTFGGMTRDLLCMRPVRIVHSNAEVYAPPALAGAVTYLFSRKLGNSPAMNIFSAMVMCMGSRYLAIQQDVKLHTWDTKNDGLGVCVRERKTKNRTQA